VNTTKNTLAVIWDFDGTLVDTRQKNLNVTRKIIAKVSGRGWNEFSVLKSIEQYHFAHNKATNWREFYKQSFSFGEQQTDESGKLWTSYQLEDNTPVLLINGIYDAIAVIGNIPQGIVSQNSKSNIERILEEKEISSYFKVIVGYEEVELKNQKPAPDGLLICIEKLVGHNSGYIFYIGDHETDIKCVLNANNILSENKIDMKIISIGALYGFDVDPSDWSNAPDYQAHKVEDVINIINEIDAFI